MDSRSEGAARTRARKVAPAVGGLPAGDAGRVVDNAGQDSPPQPAAGPAAAQRPTVHGVEVSELMLLVRQGENGWVMSGEATHEFAKVRYLGGQYKLGTGSNGRLGPFTLEHLRIDADGAWLSWTGGRKTFLPTSWYQLSWVP